MDFRESVLRAGFFDAMTKFSGLKSEMKQRKAKREARKDLKEMLKYQLPFFGAAAAATPFIMRGKKIPSATLGAQARRIVPTVRIEEATRLEKMMGAVTKPTKPTGGHVFGGGKIKGQGVTLGLPKYVSKELFGHELGHATAFDPRSSAARRGLFRARMAVNLPLLAAVGLMPNLPEKAKKPAAVGVAAMGVPLLAEEALASIKAKGILKSLGHGKPSVGRLAAALSTYAGLVGAGTYPLWANRKNS